MENFKSNYEINSTQFIEIENNGTVVNTDNKIFQIAIGSNIAALHPFFDNISAYFEGSESSYQLSCVNMNDYVCDVEIFLNNKGGAFIVLKDGTEYYNKQQEVAQKKNESIIFSEVLELRNRVLKEQENFKNQFIGNFSHELRNPLTLISSFSSLLTKTNLDLNQSQLVTAVNNQSNKLRNVLDDIIDLSFLKTGAIELKNKNLNLANFLEGIKLNYNTLLKDQSTSLTVEIAPNLPKTITTDKRRLEQIIVNFLDSAVQHNTGKAIELHIKENQRRANKLSLRIEVINDKGIVPDTDSLSSEDALKSFTKGDSATTSGLGLSIAREIAGLMEGSIRINTNETGTTQIANLKVSFPLHTVDTKEKKTKTAKEALKLTDKIRTIIAEDDDITQMTAMKVLVSTGNFDTQVYSDPSALLAAVEKYDYDVILMSGSLSQVDSIELLNLIKQFANEHNKKIPVFAVTVHTSPADVAMYRKAGFKDVIKKPYTDDELVNTIYKKIKLKKFK